MTLLIDTASVPAGDRLDYWSESSFDTYLPVHVQSAAKERITYSGERGIEGVDARGRQYPAEPRPTDPLPEFYAEHDAAFAREVENQVRVKGQEGPTGRRSRPRTALVLHRADRVRPSALERDIARFKSALAGVEVADAFLPVVAPASASNGCNEHYASEEEFVFAIADALHEEYRRIVEAGFLLQVDDAVLACTSTTRPLARRLGRRLPALGGAAGRGPQPRAQGDPRGADPLSRASAAGTARTPSDPPLGD
jgi:hypothetical protein